MQRVRDGGIRITRTKSEWTPEGAGERVYPEYIATQGTRKKPEICWYLAKRTVMAVNQGGTADKIYSSLTEDSDLLSGRFLLPPAEIKRR